MNQGCSTPRSPHQAGKLGIAGFSSVFFHHFFWKKNSFLHATYPSCHPTNSVKTLKVTQSTKPNQWPDLVLSSSITGLLKEEALLLFCWLSFGTTSLSLSLLHGLPEPLCHPNRQHISDPFRPLQMVFWHQS